MFQHKEYNEALGIITLTAIEMMTRISYEKLRLFVGRCFVVLILKCMLNLKEERRRHHFLKSLVNII